MVGLPKSDDKKLSRRDVIKMAVAATASMQAPGRGQAELPRKFQTSERMPDPLRARAPLYLLIERFAIG